MSLLGRVALSTIIALTAAGGVSSPARASTMDVSSGSSRAVTASAGDSTPTASPSVRGRVYLALGDSVTAGYQPAHDGRPAGDHPSGGYVGVTWRAMRAVVPSLKLVNMSCSGETSSSMRDDGNSYCGGRYDGTPQLAAAAAYLRKPGVNASLITLSIGANDVQRCVSRSTGSLDLGCVQEGFANLRSHLPDILKTLREAEPTAKIVILNYYNPFLASWLQGAGGQELATQSMGLLSQLNGIIADAARAEQALVADVARAFSSDDIRLVDYRGATVPRNVRSICLSTWMCTAGDIHPNDVGYAVIGAVVVRQAVWGRSVAAA